MASISSKSFMAVKEIKPSSSMETETYFILSDFIRLAAGVEKEFGYKMNPKTMQSLKTRLQSQMYGYSHIYSYGSRPMEMFLRVA